MKNKGFTLVELLIVIGVLGILAAGLLAAINPLESFRRASDATRREQSDDIRNAIIRYAAAKGDFPWNITPANGGCSPLTWGTAPSGLAFNSATLDTCIEKLVDSGELDTDFESKLGAAAGDIYLDSDSANDLTVCYAPESKNLYQDSQTIYSQDGGDLSGTTCSAATKDNGTPGSCYYCAR